MKLQARARNLVLNWREKAKNKHHLFSLNECNRLLDCADTLEGALRDDVSFKRPKKKGQQ